MSYFGTQEGNVRIHQFVSTQNEILLYSLKYISERCDIPTIK